MRQLKIQRKKPKRPIFGDPRIDKLFEQAGFRTAQQKAEAYQILKTDQMQQPGT